MKQKLHIWSLNIMIWTSATLSAQQNLVPNPSFEIYDTCPVINSQISYLFDWYNPNSHSPDYFNSCVGNGDFSVPNNYFGSQLARTGNGFVGCGLAGYNGTREYVAVQLTSTLVSGKSYYVEFYVSLSDSSNYATDDIGLSFSGSNIYNPTIDSIGLQPQIANLSGQFLMDKLNWQKISGYYSSAGGESHIIIGNFKGKQTTDSLFVGGGGTSANPNFSGAYYYFDDILIIDSIYTADNEIKVDKDLVSLNYSPEYLNIFSYYVGVQYSIIDISGRLKYSGDLTTSQNDKINWIDWSSGIYVVIIKKGDKFQAKKIIK